MQQITLGRESVPLCAGGAVAPAGRAHYAVFQTGGNAEIRDAMRNRGREATFNLVGGFVRPAHRPIFVG